MQRLHELIYRSSRPFTFYSQYHKYLFATSYYMNKRERERYEIIYYINYSSINRKLIILKYKLNNASQTNVKYSHLSENAREERIGRAQLHKTQLLLSLVLSLSLLLSLFLHLALSLTSRLRSFLSRPTTVHLQFCTLPDSTRLIRRQVDATFEIYTRPGWSDDKDQRSSRKLSWSTSLFRAALFRMDRA